MNITTYDRACPTFTKYEIAFQINRLKIHRSLRKDGIQAEILKRVGKETITRIHEIIELIWENERLPKDWNILLICSIHKKNDPQDCKNYRGICRL